MVVGHRDARAQALVAVEPLLDDPLVHDAVDRRVVLRGLVAGVVRVEAQEDPEVDVVLVEQLLAQELVAAARDAALRPRIGPHPLVAGTRVQIRDERRTTPIALEVPPPSLRQAPGHVGLEHDRVDVDVHELHGPARHLLGCCLILELGHGPRLPLGS